MSHFDEEKVVEYCPLDSLYKCKICGCLWGKEIEIAQLYSAVLCIDCNNYIDEIIAQSVEFKELMKIDMLFKCLVHGVEIPTQEQCGIMAESIINARMILLKYIKQLLKTIDKPPKEEVASES